MRRSPTADVLSGVVLLALCSCSSPSRSCQHSSADAAPQRPELPAQPHSERRECSQELRGSWSPAKMYLEDARSHHTATLLDDGRVLVIGGYESPHCHELPTPRGIELHDPLGQRPGTIYPEMPRQTEHAAVKLADGRVLSVPGHHLVRSLYPLLFDPRTDKLTSPSWASGARRGHTLTLLRDGTVIVVGGLWIIPEEIPPALRLDPEKGLSTALSGTPRRGPGHSATLLGDGRVLIAGGWLHGGERSPEELFDPRDDSFSPAGELPLSRGGHSATLLPDGRVLVAGGRTERYEGVALTSSAIFDPGTHSWQAAAPMIEPREGHTATLLPNNQVLIVGGEARDSTRGTAEIFDPETGGWCLAAAMESPHSHHTATLLSDGSVLVLGGLDGSTYNIAGMDMSSRSRLGEVFSLNGSSSGEAITEATDAEPR